MQRFFILYKEKELIERHVFKCLHRIVKKTKHLDVLTNFKCYFFNTKIVKMILHESIVKNSVHAHFDFVNNICKKIKFSNMIDHQHHTINREKLIYGFYK